MSVVDKVAFNMNDVFEFATRRLLPRLSFRTILSDSGVPISPGETSVAVAVVPSESKVVVYVYKRFGVCMCAWWQTNYGL